MTLMWIQCCPLDSVRVLLGAVLLLRPARRFRSHSERAEPYGGIGVHSESGPAEQRRKPDHLRSLYVQDLPESPVG